MPVTVEKSDYCSQNQHKANIYLLRKNIAVRKKIQTDKGVGSPKPATCRILIPKNTKDDGIREVRFNNKKILTNSNLKPAD